jgi:alkyl sulfatase BDS1-like metallo-beta-lactamase superfamily hydrolase
VGCAGKYMIGSGPGSTSKIDKYIDLAEQNYKKGNYGKAHEYLGRALLLDPNNKQTRRIRAISDKIVEEQNKESLKEIKEESSTESNSNQNNEP